MADEIVVTISTSTTPNWESVMSGSIHLAKIASGEVTSALASMMGEDSPLIAWDRSVGRIKVNGVPLAEQHARFKRPDDVIFRKQTHEAKMGADIIAGR